MTPLLWTGVLDLHPCPRLIINAVLGPSAQGESDPPGLIYLPASQLFVFPKQPQIDDFLLMLPEKAMPQHPS